MEPDGEPFHDDGVDVVDAVRFVGVVLHRQLAENVSVKASPYAFLQFAWLANRKPV
jgi:hypothetical protein